MRFSVSCCALFAALIPNLCAADDTVTVIKLAIEAQTAPKPALKYSLLPEIKDLQQGNPIPAYYKCFMEQNTLYNNKESLENREKWQKCPLAELPDDLADYGRVSLRQADYAARLDPCDWQILDRIRTDGISLLLPDLQQLRELARVLKVRYRAQVKARQFDEAIKTHQTMFALARHLGEHPTIIGNLVGIAITGLAVSPFEELIQQPGCPNLYWGLTQLPVPFNEIRRGLQGERLFMRTEFGALADPTRVWSEDDVHTAATRAKQLIELLNNEGNKRRNEELQKWAIERLGDETWLKEARKRLIDSGLPEAKVNKYPPGQVLLHDLLNMVEIARDEATKWAPIPYPFADAELLKWNEKYKNAQGVNLLVSELTPGIRNVRRAQARTEQRLAMLRIIEALRLYAAENDGKLPQLLKGCTVPLPIDPISGIPFKYKLEGATAILQSTPPKGEEKNATYNIRYEVTIKK